MRGPRQTDAEGAKAATPTPSMLVNVPTADSVTPSDNGPGTPNSTMTSMSELSTVAIKDGHRGHFPHLVGGRESGSMTHFDSERADRIGRMAGLDRITQHLPLRNNGVAGSNSLLHQQQQHQQQQQQSTGPYQPTVGYFLPTGEARLMKSLSTVGSASATSATKESTNTWTSESVDENDENDDNTTTTDKISIQSETSSMMGDGNSSSVWNGVSGLSDGGSLVGFDEDAGSRPSRIPQPQATFSASHPALTGPRSSQLPYTFPSHLRPRSPSSVSNRAPSLADSSASRAGEARLDAAGRGRTGTPPLLHDRDVGPPNGRNLTTVERAEVELRGWGRRD